MCVFFLSVLAPVYSFFFFFNDTATTEIYTLSLHDALPISTSMASSPRAPRASRSSIKGFSSGKASTSEHGLDRKSTRLNSSHLVISYAVFCLKKKKKTEEKTAVFIAKIREHLQPIAHIISI